jgi:hypothetical protein
MNTLVGRAGAVLGLILFLSSPLRGEATPQPRLITVTGDAEVRVVPDEVVLTLGVETHDRDMSLAKSQNDERVKKLLAAAKDHKIEPKYVQTDYINIEPRYRGNCADSEFLGYFVRKTVVLTLKDVPQFESVLSDVLNAGANYVHGIRFRTTELRKYRDQARALAIKAAREKAEALAGELGQKVGKPHSIQESRNWWWSGYSSWWGGQWGGQTAQNVIQDSGGRGASEEGTLALGQITVNASVTVSFELE